MEKNAAKNMARAARRERRLGPDAACIICGTKTPEALTLVKRMMLEAHHVAGRAHDDALTVPVCLNCHRVLTEGQNAAGVDFAPQGTKLERLAAILHALGAFLCQLGESVQAWAGWLWEHIAGLDRDYPDWRGKEWARA